jgi:hypothetical protein
MAHRLRLAFAALAAWCAFAGAVAAGVHDDALLAQGRAIYREGRLPSGAPLVGTAQAGVVRTGRDAACLSCHRRSGFGTAEGNFVIRPLTGPDLYGTRARTAPNPRIEHQLGKPGRPVYDDALLARAVRTGSDAGGRTMQEAMPRYALGDSDMAALAAYLKTLFAEEAPGVTATEIHLATVIQPGVPEASRRTMLAVLENFVREKNAGVRSEEVRRTAGTMRMFRAYRKWVLHVWDLAGPPAGWPGQLEEHYRRQPVFALVAGIGTQTWQPVHAFSERFELPCVLPLTDLPAASDDDFYTVYFSRGVALEARALAQYIASRGAAGPMVQVYRANEPGAVAAAAFRAALPGADRLLQDRPLAGDPDPAFWRDAAQAAPGGVVLWLGARDVAAAHALAQGPRVPDVYLSRTLSGPEEAPASLHPMLTYAWEVPALREPRVLRSRLWLRSHGLDAADEETQAVAVNTLFAVSVAGEALAHLQDSFSRDYFVERVEHTVTTTIAPTFFPHVNLGQGKRFASKGAYIVQRQPSGSVNVVSDLIVP